MSGIDLLNFPTFDLNLLRVLKALLTEPQVSAAALRQPKNGSGFPARAFAISPHSAQDLEAECSNHPAVDVQRKEDN
jgi:hypothetical protein